MKFSIIKEKIKTSLKRTQKYTGTDNVALSKNSFWVLMRQGFALIFAIIVSVAATRLLTKEIFGQYQLVLAILSTLAFISIPGLNSTVIKAVARGKDGDYAKAVKTSFLWSLIATPILMVIGLVFYINGDITVGLGCMIGALFFPFLYAPNTWHSLFQGKEKFKTLTLWSTTQGAIHAVAMAIAIFLFRDNVLLLILTYFSSQTIFNSVFYKKSLKFVNNKDKEEDTITYGFFLTKIRILSQISGYLDKIVVGIFISPEALAVYSIGVMFAEKTQQFVKGLTSIVTPKIARHGFKSKRHYFYVFILTLAFSLLLVLISPFIITFLFSEKYSESIILSQIMFLFLPFYVIHGFYQTDITYYHIRKKILAGGIMISAIISIILIFVILPLFDIAGLAALKGSKPLITLLVFIALTGLAKRLP